MFQSVEHYIVGFLLKKEKNVSYIASLAYYAFSSFDVTLPDCYAVFINMEGSMEMHSFTGLAKIKLINIFSVRLLTN